MKGCKKPTQGGRGECGDSRKGERVREEEAGWEEVVEEVGGEVHFRGSLALARPNRAHLFFVCPGPILVTCGKSALGTIPHFDQVRFLLPCGQELLPHWGTKRPKN